MDHIENEGSERLGQAERWAACEQHRSAVIRCCLPILKNWHDAEDAAAHAIERALREPSQIDDPKAWLCRVAKNVALDVVRRKKIEARALRTLAASAREAGPARGSLWAS